MTWSLPLYEMIETLLKIGKLQQSKSNYWKKFVFGHQIIQYLQNEYKMNSKNNQKF